MEKDDIFEKLLKNSEHVPKVNYIKPLKITKEDLIKENIKTASFRETNRDKLLNKSLYDLLSEINDGYDRYLCIVEKLEGDRHYDEDGFRCQNTATKEQCSKCIQRYLNEG